MDNKESKKNRTDYKNQYQKTTATRINLVFRNDSDSEIISKIKSVPNKTDYIRQLVLNDINSKQNPNL